MSFKPLCGRLCFRYLLRFSWKGRDTGPLLMTIHSVDVFDWKDAVLINDKCHLIADGISRRTNERQGRINDDKSPGLERSTSYRADPILLSTHKLKSENVTHEVNHEYSRKRQNGDIRRFWGAQRSHGWGSPRGWLIWFKYRKVRVYKGFFPTEKLVNYCL